MLKVHGVHTVVCVCVCVHKTLATLVFMFYPENVQLLLSDFLKFLEHNRNLH